MRRNRPWWRPRRAESCAETGLIEAAPTEAALPTLLSRGCASEAPRTSSPPEAAAAERAETTAADLAAAAVADDAAPVAEAVPSSSASLLPSVVFADTAEPMRRSRARTCYAEQPGPEAPQAAFKRRRGRRRTAAPSPVAAPAVTPELVEVWRPGGRSEERRPRHDRNRHQRHDRPADGSQPVGRRRNRDGRQARQP